MKKEWKGWMKSLKKLIYAAQRDEIDTDKQMRRYMIDCGPVKTYKLTQEELAEVKEYASSLNKIIDKKKGQHE